MDKNQNDFADRLRRIEAKKGVKPVAPKKASQPKQKQRPAEKQKEGGGLTPLMTMGLVFLLAISAAAGGFIWYMLPQWKNQKTELAQKAAEEEAQKGPKTASEIAQVFKVKSPLGARRKDQSNRLLSYYGWQLWPGHAMFPNQTTMVMSVLTTGYEKKSGEVPGKVTPLEPNKRCQLRRPKPGEVVRNVRIEKATGESGLHVYAKTDMAEALLDHISGQFGRRNAYKTGSTADGRMYQADVLVTDTSGPVYLVLQTLNQNTLWNLHLAPDVTLAHVAMIGKNNALVGLPNGVEAEALRIGDFVPDFEPGDEEEGQSCMVAPYRKPKENWKGVDAANAGNEKFVRLMETYETGHAAFNAWYKGALGVDADTNLTEANTVAHVVAGPNPSGAIPYRSIKGEPVLVTDNDLILKGDAAVQKAHAEILVEAAGGDIAKLDPRPVDRSSAALEATVEGADQ